MRRLGLSILAISGVLFVTACGPEAQIGGFDDPAEEAGPLLEGALDDLIKKPVLEFEGAIDELTGSGEPATVQLGTVTGGVSYGTAEISGVEIEVMTVDGVYYVRADKDFWVSQGVEESHAKRIDGEWTQVDPAVWFDPGSLLSADQYGEALRQTLEDNDALTTWLPEPVDCGGGVQCYPIAVGNGTVFVTVDEPHTIVKIDQVPVTMDGNTVTLNVTVAGIDADAVEKLFKDLADAVDDISTIYDDGADLQLSESNGEFTCNSDASSCKFTDEVTATLNGDYHLADKVKITMKATATSDDLGDEKKCDDSATIDIDETAKLSCKVGFSLPANGVTYHFDGDWTLTGLATFKPDTDKIADALDEQLDQLLSQY